MKSIVRKSVSDSILEHAVKQVIERLKYLEEWGNFTPNDAFTLGYLEQALEMYRKIEKDEQ